MRNGGEARRCECTQAGDMNTFLICSPECHTSQAQAQEDIGEAFVRVAREAWQVLREVAEGFSRTRTNTIR